MLRLFRTAYSKLLPIRSLWTFVQTIPFVLNFSPDLYFPAFSISHKNGRQIVPEGELVVQVFSR